ncbi:MAG: galactose-1-phosphate uridylyltransferase [Candidatus Eremiobacteraeota bacterium]|nr:galactose-1-phosphate uridylyltransferase [Candidatus Eremiobacteraeota bacterium]
MKHQASAANLYELIELFLARSLELKLTTHRDIIYLRNKLYLTLGLSAPRQFPSIAPDSLAAQSLATIAENIYLSLDGARSARLGENQEQAETHLIDLLLPLPGTVENIFRQLQQNKGIKAAIDWYYQFSKDTNYIRTADIAKDQSWQSRTPFGHVEITINLSKPEKDPLDIARANLIKPENIEYPKCPLCIENEGYAGSSSQASRHNHRLLEIQLNNKPWFFQYSPYSYYPEHSIVIDPVHCDMAINQNTFANLFDFVDSVPHYIIGSNSDIPIVGGSILCHDHYQAGNHIFPIEKAKIKNTYKIDSFAHGEVNHLSWPVTTLRLIGSRQDLTLLITIVMAKWYGYNNHELDIISHDAQGNRHNGITPIMRKLDKDKYCVYLLLRNNRTTDQHPEGIFHPHRHLHHIKMENIGLIEAMGLAILPGRLAGELAELEKLLLLNDKKSALSKLSSDQSMGKHEQWLAALYDKYDTFHSSDVKEIIMQEVADKFVQVIECSGVFKETPEGNNAMALFISSLK